MAEEASFDVYVRVLQAEGLPPVEVGGGCNTLVRGESSDQVLATSVQRRTRSPAWPPHDVGEELLFKDVTRSDEVRPSPGPAQQVARVCAGAQGVRREDGANSLCVRSILNIPAGLERAGLGQWIGGDTCNSGSCEQGQKLFCGGACGRARRGAGAGWERPQIVLKVLSKSRSGVLSYIGYVRLTLTEVYPLCLPGDVVSLPPAAEGFFSRDADTRVLPARWWPLDHRAHQGAELYTGGGGADCCVFKWDVASGSILRSYPRRALAGESREGHGSSVTGLAVADVYGVRRLFSASLDGTVRTPHPAAPARAEEPHPLLSRSAINRLSIRLQ